MRVPEQACRTRFLEGASVTAYRGDSVAVACSADLSPVGCTTAAEAAAGRLDSSETDLTRARWPQKIQAAGNDSPILEPWPDRRPAASLLESVRQLAETCFGAVPEAREVAVELGEDTRRIFIATTYGNTSSRSLHLASVAVTCRLHDHRVLRAAAGGADVSDPRMMEAVCRDIRRQAGARRDGAAFLGESTPVVLAAGWCAGTWLHEAAGHFFEGDNVLRGWGPFQSPGASVAPSSVNILDDPGERGGRGSYAEDDEGVAGGRTVLVEEGVVRGHLHSLGTAAASGERSSGNGRRQDFRFVPAPRMSNLILENGRESRETVLGGLENGLLVHSLSSGEVDGPTGRFSFDVLLGEMIDSGPTGEYVAGLALFGAAESALSGIRAVCDDRTTDAGRGTCRKSGQHVPVGLTSPTILVEGLTVRSLE